MYFVGLAPDLLSGFEFLGNVWIACYRDESWEPVEPGDNAVFHLTRRHLARPTYDRWHAKATFQSGPFAACERSLAAVGPSKVLGTVVGAEGNNGVIIEAVVFHVLHYGADNV